MTLRQLVNKRSRLFLVLLIPCLIIAVFLVVGPFMSPDASTSPIRRTVFNWGAPVQFKLKETICKDNTEATLMHKLRFDQTNNEYRLRWLDARFLDINGRKINTNQPDKSISEAEEIWKSLPALRISSQGRFLGLADPEKAMDDVRIMIEKSRGQTSRESSEALVQFMKQPQSAELLKTVCAAPWARWVENWIDIDLTQTTTVLTNSSIDCFGTAVPARTVIENLGKSRRGETLRHLRIQTMATGPEYRKALTSWMESGGKKLDDVILDASSEYTIEIITDPATLRPKEASSLSRVILHTQEKNDTTNSEWHYYQFYWPAVDKVVH
jgi:hypothetical protein